MGITKSKDRFTIQHRGYNIQLGNQQRKQNLCLTTAEHFYVLQAVPYKNNFEGLKANAVLSTKLLSRFPRKIHEKT